MDDLIVALELTTARLRELAFYAQHCGMAGAQAAVERSKQTAKYADKVLQQEKSKMAGKNVV